MKLLEFRQVTKRVKRFDQFKFSPPQQKKIEQLVSKTLCDIKQTQKNVSRNEVATADFLSLLMKNLDHY